MDEPIEIREEQMLVIRARLEEPPPLLALEERKRGNHGPGRIPALLQEDLVALVDEVDRLRAELGGNR
jgi:hypothetical protein